MVTYIQLKLYVRLEKFFFGAHPNSGAHYFACRGQVQSANLKLSKQIPNLRERELFMRNEVQRRLVYLTGTIIILEA
jgi:hypothetical protein